MEPGVPFALLAAAELVSVAAALGLAAAGFSRALRGAASIPVLAGGVALGVADVLTMSRLGQGESSPDDLVRLVGFALLAVGFLLAGRRGAPDRMAGSIAPLGAALPAAVGAAAVGALAALAALRWRHPAARLISLGLGLQAAAAACGDPARSHDWAALAVLVLRGSGGLVVLAGLAVVGRESLLSKVVQSILAGAVLTAVATAGIVGTVVASQLSASQTRQVTQAAVADVADLDAVAASAQQDASLLNTCAPAEAGACGQAVLKFSTGDVFTALVSPHGQVRVLSANGATLDTADELSLAGQPAIAQALAISNYAGIGFVVLRGDPQLVVALGVSHTANDPAGYVAVCGALVDNALLGQARTRSAFDATVLTLPDGDLAASSLPARQANALAAEARSDQIPSRAAALVDSAAGDSAVLTRTSQGTDPTVAYAVLPSGTDAVAVLAVSVPAGTILHTQRVVLELLCLAVVAIGVAVAGLAFVVGRRVVNPIRRLTTTASMITSGDLSARAEVAGHDEVTELSRAFDAMTTSLVATAEEEMATRGRLETVLNSIDDGLLVTGNSGQITGVNPSATRLFGAELGTQLTTTLRDPSGEALPEQGEGVIAGVGGPVPVEVRRSQLPDGAGQVVLVRDVTAQRQVDRMKTQFLANVSHELRTPLTPISAYADMLRRNPDLPPRAAAFATEIATAARRMTRVVNLLVEVAAIDAGRAGANAAAVPVGPFVSRRLKDWKERVPQRSGDLRRRVSSGLPAMFVDEGWLTRCLDELIDNALKFSPAGTAVVVGAAASETDGWVRLSVRDSGPGIAEADRATLFADFEQVDGSATRAAEGLGLGLSFARRAAEVAGLELSVESPPGGGALFVVTVPTVDTPGN